MALIECIECRLLISETAVSCPHCGYLLRKKEYKTFEVVTSGFTKTGQNELDSLLRKGWQITDCDDSETWTDGDGYECRAYKYRLVRN